MDGLDRSRAFLKEVKRLVIKVGTAVVTRADGRLALGRLGALCEQIKDLNAQGYEVIVVSSGAVGLGRQRLKYRRLVNSSFADLQKPQVELDGKACAAVGQNCLMALYDTLFSQLDVTSAQLLVTDNDFRDKAFRNQLSETVQSLLALKVIPIFNENDAVSTRRAPYEDSSGIFWDNDSLAALLALELKADLLVLLSDVEGLYSGPPSDPKSKLIHTYVKEKHQGGITFGDKSRVGRGGMTAKVKAAVNAAYAGIPVVITSGYAPENIIKVLQGECLGTLFHQDAHLWATVKECSSREMAVAARESSRRLQAISSHDRKKILLDIADALEANEKLIKTENEADVTTAQQAGYEKSLIARLALKPGKISSLANSIRVLANMEDPIGRILKRTELAGKMALQAGISSSKVLVLAGAGWTVSVVLRSGRLSELIAQLQVLLRGVDEAEISSDKYDSAALTAQIRQLAQEIRELAVSHPVTVFNGNSASSGSYASYLVPAAALGAMGYCYMWWKGWSLSDVMFVTKHNMANAVATVSKQLENVNEALSATKRHLTQKLENLDWKVEEHKETSKLIANDVNEVKSNLSQIGFDVESIHQMLSGLEGKIELLESKQDMTNSGLWYLCQVAGGFKDGLNAKLFKQDVGDTVANHSTITFEETSLKGLQFIAETKDSGVIDKSTKTTRIIDPDNFPGEKARAPKNRIHRSYPVGMSLAEIL